MLSVLSRNLANSAIETIVLMTNQIYSFTDLPNIYKIRQVIISGRLTFEKAFKLANAGFSYNKNYSNSIVIIANSDIYFDNTLENLQYINFTQKVLALSKWKHEHGDESITFSPRTDSQDAWVFSPRLPNELIKQMNFYLGAPRCDNRVARIFVDMGYDVLNPVFYVHAIEIDTRLRDATYGYEGAVFGPVKYVLLSANL
eukprot:gene5995-12081_t